MPNSEHLHRGTARHRDQGLPHRLLPRKVRGFVIQKFGNILKKIEYIKNGKFFILSNESGNESIKSFSFNGATT